MTLIIIVIVCLVLLTIFGNASNGKTASRNTLLWPIMIIGTILFFPIAVILELTKKYK